MSGPILIWGTGAVGGSLGAAFARAREAVIFVDQDAAHVAAMNAKGLAITGPVDPHRVPAKAVLPGSVEGRFGRIVLAVKSHHTAGALDDLARHLEPDGFVISAQNGLEERRIAAALGQRRCFGCFVNFGADYLEPGVISYGGRGAVVVGEIDGTRTARLEAVAQLFRHFDDRVIATSNIWGYTPPASKPEKSESAFWARFPPESSKAIFGFSSGRSISVGQARLRRDVVCDGADRRQHRRRPGDRAASADPDSAGP